MIIYHIIPHKVNCIGSCPIRSNSYRRKKCNGHKSCYCCYCLPIITHPTSKVAQPGVPTWIKIPEWVVKAISIPVKPLFTSGLQLFNDQVQGFFSKNVITLKIHIFFFQLKAFQLKEKNQPDFQYQAIARRPFCIYFCHGFCG